MNGLRARLPWFVVSLATSPACGRIAFDPLTDGASDVALLTYRDAVLEDAPVSYWRLGDLGAATTDEMGMRPGMISGTCDIRPGALAGDADQAIRFDGATCRIDIAEHLDFSGTAAFSVELWVSLEQQGSQQPYVMNDERAPASPPQNGFALLEGSSPGAYFERTAVGSNRTTPRYSAALGVFTHLVGVYDGSQISLYVDGAAFMSSVAATAASDMTRTALTLGAYPPTTGNIYMIGTLDEVAIYDHVLAPDRIALHHTIGTLGPQPR